MKSILHLSKKWWRGVDSNHRRQSRQIYSLIPLATREPLRANEAAYCPREDTSCQHRNNNIPLKFHDLHNLTQASHDLALNFKRIKKPGENFLGFSINYGAGTKSRTRDLLITSQLLYQLSYAGNLLFKMPLSIKQCGAF